MSTLAIVLLCAQVCFFQSVFSQCLRSDLSYGFYGDGLANGFGFGGTGYGLGNYGYYGDGIADGFGFFGAGYGLGSGLGYGYGAGLNAAQSSLAAADGIGAAGFPSPAGAFGGVGNGNMLVAGDLPVGGPAVISGAVPIIGAVGFDGILPAFGTVSVSGRSGCTCGLGL